MEKNQDLNQFIKEELTKLHKITLLEEQKKKITLKLKLLNENAAEINEKLIDFDIPEWAMSALINGDYSGLENEDEEKLKNFIKNVSSEYGNANFMLGNIDGDDNLGFKWHNDIDNLGNNVYRLYIMPSHELNEAKDKVELTFLKVDEGTGEFIYRGSDGKIYISISGVIHDVTDEMEPLAPVHNTIIKPGEPIYNPEDRFGRNPGSKLQTETKDIKAMYTKAGMESPHPGKGIHTKKFHKCVTSVGDEGGKNPYAICMASLGKDKAVKAAHRTDETIGIEYENCSKDSNNCR